MSKAELLSHASSLMEEDRKLTIQIIDCLREVERRQLHLELGRSSLWHFCVNHLGMSESSAQLRIQAMRLSRENPEVRECLDSGTLTLSTAAQLQSFFRAETQAGNIRTIEEKTEIIRSVEGLSKRETEKKLLEISPNSIPKEKERSVSPTHVELKIILDQNVMDQLNILKGLLAHRLSETSYSELIQFMVKAQLSQLEKEKYGKSEKKESSSADEPDSVIKADEPKVDRTQDTSLNVNTSIVDSYSSQSLCLDKVTPSDAVTSEDVTEDCSHSKPILIPARRGYVPVASERAIWRRAKGRCEFVSDGGVRCQSRFSLQIDHCTPVSLCKGASTPGRLLCRSHNIQQAVKMLGHEVMRKYVPGIA